MNNRIFRGVELPLHQPVLWSQLQYFVGVKDVLEWWPATVFISLEDHRQFKRRGDTGVREDAPHRLQTIFDLYIDYNGGAPKPAGLISRGVHHVLADPVGHPARQQQHLAVEGGSFGLCQAARDLLGHITQKELLSVLKARIQAVNCRRKQQEHC